MTIAASTIIPTAAYRVGGTPAEFMARLERFLPAWMAANYALPDYSGLSPAEIRDRVNAEYDARHKLSDAYYRRDTSHWAGR